MNNIDMRPYSWLPTFDSNKISITDESQYGIFYRDISEDQIPQLEKEFQIYEPFDITAPFIVSLVDYLIKNSQEKSYFGMNIDSDGLHAVPMSLRLNTTYKDVLFIEFNLIQKEENKLKISLSPGVYKNKPTGQKLTGLEDLKFHIYFKNILTAPTIFDFLDRTKKMKTLLNIPEVNTYQKVSLNSKLDQAIADQDETEIASLFKLGADIDYVRPFGNGCTRLMEASKKGNVNSAKMLLKLGAEVNWAEPNLRTTALLYAIQEGNLEIAELLMEAGADIHHDGEEAIRLCLLNGVNSPNYLALAKLLISRGANWRNLDKTILDQHPWIQSELTPEEHLLKKIS